MKAIICSLGILAFIGLLIFTFWVYGTSEIEKGDLLYHQGEVAATVAEKKKSFNEALVSYLSAEEKYSPEFGNGKLYFNIGNTYFQLGEYPLALFYYKSAEKLMPRSEEIKSSVEHVEQLLHVSENKKRQTFMEKMFTPWIAFSMPELLQLFGFSGIIAWISAWLYVWNPHSMIREIRTAGVTIAIIALLALAKNHYMEPVQGVVIHAFEMQLGPSKDSGRVNQTPVPPGTMVNLLDIDAKSPFVKVSLPDGEIGFVTEDNVRFLHPNFP